MKLLIIFLWFWVGLSTLVNAQAFELKKGINIPHSLAMTWGSDFAKQKAVFQESDAQWLVAHGYNHIRLPVEEQVLFNTEMVWNEQNRNLLHEMIRICKANKLKVIVVLYNTTGSHNVFTQWRSIYNDTVQEAHLYKVWDVLQKDLKQYGNDELAYEIINEPVAPTQEDWNRVLGKAIKRIRKLEPNRWLVAGSNYWQSYDRIWGLRLPKGDAHIIISFHYYQPFLLTHYGASFTPTGNYKGAIHYPGITIQPNDIPENDTTLAKAIKYHNKVYNLDTLKKHIQEAVSAAKVLGLPLYCGEIGIIKTCPSQVAAAYRKDILAALAIYGIPFAWWDYKGSFAVME